MAAGHSVWLTLCSEHFATEHPNCINTSNFRDIFVFTCRAVAIAVSLNVSSGHCTVTLAMLQLRINFCIIIVNRK